MTFPIDTVAVRPATRRGSTARNQGRVPLNRVGTPNVRFGSKADIASGSRHVRFTPKSGHASVSWTRLSEREASWLPLGGLADRKGGNLYLGENL
jgi:hypothetical protein